MDAECSTKNLYLSTRLQGRVIAYSLSSHRGDQGGIWGGFLRVFLFPLPIFIPPAAPYSLIILSLSLYSLDTDSVVMQQAIQYSNARNHNSEAELVGLAVTFWARTWQIRISVGMGVLA
jgi:hypothetical protein